jgi:hypothetical protein
MDMMDWNTKKKYYGLLKNTENIRCSGVHQIKIIKVEKLGEMLSRCYEKNIQDEGKVRPRTGHEDPEGEWRYGSTFFNLFLFYVQLQ